MNADREKLTAELMRATLAVNDCTLFLDTHPTSAEALDYYKKWSERLDALERKYVAAYGPLSANAVPPADRWTWTDAPWPWEYEPERGTK